MKKFALLLLMLTGFLCHAQTGVKTSIDTTRNKIGAQFTLTLKTTADTSQTVIFPKGKAFGALEVIRSYPIDTVKKDKIHELIKKYGLTQFDSGKYTIPRLPVKVGNQTFFSDSIKVEVSNVPVDTLKQKLYDIKDVVRADGDNNWWIYILILVIVATVGYFGYQYWRKHRKPKQEEEIYKTPIEKATVLLQQLERKELVQKGEVKAYYSELTDIARTFIEEAVHIPAMESTTSELIEKLRLASVKKNISLTPETVANLEKVLFQADLVKFAKERPLEYEIADDRKKIESTLVTINSAIPDEPDDEDELLQERIRLQKLKEKKRRERRRAIGIFLGLAAAFLAASLILDELGYNSIFNSRTEKLLKGEWIYSEYGNPSVAIETPKVLTRLDANKIMDPKSIAVLKEFQMFGFGGLTDEVYILVSTNKFKDTTDVNLDLVVEGSIKDWEAKGAQNILVKKEEFTTKAGISGIRAYGTMAVLDGFAKRSSKLYYEMLYFKQDQGLQQVFVAHEEGDESGQEILERVISSVELQIGAQ